MCAGLAAAARIDHGEKHPLTDPKLAATAGISRHGREGISYPSETIGMPPAEFHVRVKKDAERYRKVVQQAGIQPQ